MWDWNSTLLINIYNDLGFERTSYIHVPFSQSSGFNIVDSSNNPVLFQTNELSEIDMNLQFQVSGTKNSKFSITFAAKLPSVGFSSYFLVPSDSYLSNTFAIRDKDSENNIYLMNSRFIVGISGITNKIISLTNKFDGVSIDLNQSWAFYNSSIGDASTNQPSGAYIFRPQQSEATEVSSDTSTKIVTRGVIYDELFSVFSNYTSQRIRVYHDTSEYAEVEYTVGPIPIFDFVGKEVICRFNTSIKSDNNSFTDANGRSIQKRKLDHRPTWNLEVNEPISQNYFPINSAISISDKTTQFTVLVDRAQGGASLSEGEIELMVHRRLLTTDHRGVGPLNELGLDGNGLITRGVYRLLLNSPSNFASIMHSNSLDLSHNTRVSVAKLPSSINAAEYAESYKTQFSYLKSNLPLNVHLQTLEILPHSPRQVLFRLAHIFAIGEDDIFSEPVTIDLSTLFDTPFINVTETTLSSNLELSNYNPLVWSTNSNHQNVSENKVFESTLVGNTIVLYPMEIRTYILNY